MAAIANLHHGPARQGIAQDGGRMAFGYTPERWPSPHTFGQPVTELQVKMVRTKSRDRGIPNEDLPFIRTLVLDAYQVGDANSKGNASLFIDWLMNADEEAIEAALYASSTYEDDGAGPFRCRPPGRPSQDRAQESLPCLWWP